jgi:DNA (cytosine-5)-methyltransferase 1
MFAGIGGICLGFKQAECEIIWANEKDRTACRTYRFNHSDDVLVEKDVYNVAPNEIPDMDILTAGFPCQSFSIAGNQKGFADPRGNLFFEIARVLDAKRPQAVFLENVNNLVEHDDGKTFLVIYNSLVHFGYYVRYRVLSAHEYCNIPQPRSRIYIVAFLDSQACDGFEFPEPMELTIGINDIINRSERKHEVYYYQPDSHVVKKYGKKIIDRNYIYRLQDSGLVRVRNNYCPTLTAQMGTYPDRVPLVVDNFGIRKLTLRECLDFQGFPADFKFPKTISIEDAYRQIGNSVCVPVVKRLAERLSNLLQ